MAVLGCKYGLELAKKKKKKKKRNLKTKQKHF